MRIATWVIGGMFVLSTATGLAVGSAVSFRAARLHEDARREQLSTVVATLAAALPGSDLEPGSGREDLPSSRIRTAVDSFQRLCTEATAVSIFRPERDGLKPIFDTGMAGRAMPAELGAAAERCYRDEAPTSAISISASTARSGGTITCAPIRSRGTDVVAVLGVEWQGGDGFATGALWVLLAMVLGAASAGIAARWIGRPLRRMVSALGQAPTPLASTASMPAILQSVATLVDETRAAKDAASALENRGAQKDQLLANTAHELRTPLTTIMAAVDILRDGYATTPEERFTFMDQASAACHHMLFLLNDLLDTAAWESGSLRLDMQTCFTHDLLDDALRILMPLATVRNMTLDVQKPARDVAFRGDPNRTLQVIFNMVSNALKYSPPRTEVRIRAVGHEDIVEFEIQDEGIGVADSSAEKLFTRFARVHDSQSSSARGTGIGLYLSKVLVEQMGGRIGYRRRTDGTGSVFWFELRAGIPTPTPLTVPATD